MEKMNDLRKEKANSRIICCCGMGLESVTSEGFYVKGSE